MTKQNLAKGFGWGSLHGQAIICDMGDDVLAGIPHQHYWRPGAASSHCYAPEPPTEKEPDMDEIRKLADQYTRVREQKVDGRTIIFRDSETGLCELRDGSRRCWIEGVDKVPDYVYAPEPEPQEFREEDGVVEDGGFYRRVFATSRPPASLYPDDFIGVEGLGGGRYWISAHRLTLVHRCLAPTGPIRVGSTVKVDHCGYTHHGQQGAVVPNRGPLDFDVLFSDGAIAGFQKADLKHIASLEDH